MSGFTFINTDTCSRATQEAIKVHVLRLRHESHRNGQSRCKGRRTEEQHGGQFHIRDLDREQDEQSSPLATNAGSCSSPGKTERTASESPLALSCSQSIGNAEQWTHDKATGLDPGLLHDISIGSSVGSIINSCKFLFDLLRLGADDFMQTCAKQMELMLFTTGCIASERVQLLSMLS